MFIETFSPQQMALSWNQNLSQNCIDSYDILLKKRFESVKTSWFSIDYKLLYFFIFLEFYFVKDLEISMIWDHLFSKSLHFSWDGTSIFQPALHIIRTAINSWKWHGISMRRKMTHRVRFSPVSMSVWAGGWKLLRTSLGFSSRNDGLDCDLGYAGGRGESDDPPPPSP